MAEEVQPAQQIPEGYQQEKLSLFFLAPPSQKLFQARQRFLTKCARAIEAHVQAVQPPLDAETAREKEKCESTEDQLLEQRRQVDRLARERQILLPRRAKEAPKVTRGEADPSAVPYFLFGGIFDFRDTDRVRAVCASKCGRWIAVAAGGTVVVFKAFEQGLQIVYRRSHLPGKPVTALTLLEKPGPQERLAVMAAQEATCWVWRLGDDQKGGTFQVSARGGEIEAMAVESSSFWTRYQVLLACKNHKVELWSLSPVNLLLSVDCPVNPEVRIRQIFLAGKGPLIFGPEDSRPDAQLGLQLLTVNEDLQVVKHDKIPLEGRAGSMAAAATGRGTLCVVVMATGSLMAQLLGLPGRKYHQLPGAAGDWSPADDNEWCPPLALGKYGTLIVGGRNNTMHVLDLLNPDEENRLMVTPHPIIRVPHDPADPWPQPSALSLSSSSNLLFVLCEKHWEFWLTQYPHDDEDSPEATPTLQPLRPAVLPPEEEVEEIEEASPEEWEQEEEEEGEEEEEEVHEDDGEEWEGHPLQPYGHEEPENGPVEETGLSQELETHRAEEPETARAEDPRSGPETDPEEDPHGRSEEPETDWAECLEEGPEESETWPVEEPETEEPETGPAEEPARDQAEEPETARADDPDRGEDPES